MKKLLPFLKTDIAITLIVAILWQSLLLFIGWFIAKDQGVLGHMSHWDAGWYKSIITHGYSDADNPAAPAFYPLFPLLVSGVSLVTFGAPHEVAALIINTVALWLALLALLRIGEYFSIKSRSTKTILIAAFLSFPSAFFLHTFYGEAIFIAIGLWSYLFALQKKWWATGILLALITASRLPGLLFVALCGLEFLRAHDWNIKKSLNPKILWFLLAPIGFLLYGLALHFIRGDFLAMFHAYTATNDWVYQKFNPNIIDTIYETGATVTHAIVTLNPTYEIFINYALPLASIVLIIASSIYLWKRKPYGPPLALFGLLSIILFSLNSNLVSVHRYTLACLPIFIAIGLLAKHRKAAPYLVVAGVISIGVQLFIYSKFINDVFAG